MGNNIRLLRRSLMEQWHNMVTWSDHVCVEKQDKERPCKQGNDRIPCWYGTTLNWHGTFTCLALDRLELFVPLHQPWMGYMLELLGLGVPDVSLLSYEGTWQDAKHFLHAHETGEGWSQWGLLTGEREVHLACLLATNPYYHSPTQVHQSQNPCFVSLSGICYGSVCLTSFNGLSHFSFSFLSYQINLQTAMLFLWFSSPFTSMPHAHLILFISVQCMAMLFFSSLSFCHCHAVALCLPSFPFHNYAWCMSLPHATIHRNLLEQSSVDLIQTCTYKPSSI